MEVKAINVAMEEFKFNIRRRRFQILMALFAIISLGMVYGSKRLGASADLYKTPFQMLFLSSFSNALNYSIALSGVLLGTTATNEEKERGTLRILLSKPVHRDEIMIGRAFGRAFYISLHLCQVFLSYKSFPERLL